MCTASNYKDANHAPNVTITEGIDLTAAPGDKITLHAKGEDPDGNNITYKWWHYPEADSYEESNVKKNDPVENKTQGLLLSITRKLAEGETTDNISLEGSDTDTLTFTVPKDAKSGDKIHIIAEVQDDGKFTLKSYERVIITIK